MGRSLALVTKRQNSQAEGMARQVNIFRNSGTVVPRSAFAITEYVLNGPGERVSSCIGFSSVFAITLLASKIWNQIVAVN